MHSVYWSQRDVELAVPRYDSRHKVAFDPAVPFFMRHAGILAFGRLVLEF